MQPRATYRLQLHAGFTFGDAAAAIPYLAELGVSHLYLSPILEAAEGSLHGYDIVDPEHVRAALGGELGLRALAEAAQRAGLGLLVDIVPNHMSIAGRGNRWWMDVLENGPASAYADYFDVDWTSPPDDRVLLPVLKERYGRALQSGAIEVVSRGGGRFVVRADEAELPLAPSTLGTLVRRAAERIGHAELAFIGDALAALPAPQRSDVEARRRRHRDRLVLESRLAALCEDGACSAAVAGELHAVNGDPAELDAILEGQAYRLAHWSVAGSQLGYRRFFDIATLVGVRDEDPAVFDACHAKVLALVGGGVIDGLRIDHVDGLRDPGDYLARLRARAPEAWLVVEKILAPGELVPASWPIDGTTGYEFLDTATGVLVDPEGERPMTRLFEDFTGEAWHPRELSRAAKLEIMTDALHSELARLTELAARACSNSPACRDYTRAEIETALAEILAGYSVYRTYLRAGPGGDEATIERSRVATAVQAARDARPELDRDLLAYLEAALAFEQASADAIELAYSAQQITGALAAKGDEDTVAYRAVRLLARVEVGTDAGAFALDPAAVHRTLAAGRPRALLATSTHDAKRGEDVRARLAVLSEIPAAWAGAVLGWRARADRYWDVPADRVLEYALWQTLVGAWPLSLDRARAFARKAAREARRRTAWRHTVPAFEAAVDAWLERVYADEELAADLARFVGELAPHGDRNALAQLVIKLAAPGVPDFYWGCEQHDDSLVDPDNRRPIDFAARRDGARWLTDAQPLAVAQTHDPSAIKLWTIRRVLSVRRREPGWWEGAYRPLATSGAHAHRVFAFARGDDLVAVVPRLGVRADGWRETAITLPSGAWRDALSDQTFTGGEQPVAPLWRIFPVALLVRG